MQSKINDYAEHRGLLVDHLTEVHGPLAAKIADRLLAVGSATLKDIADHIRTKEPFGDEPSSVIRGAGAGSAGVLHTPQVPIGSATNMRLATDREIKFTLATLLQHNVVAFDRNDNTYCVLVGQGLFQFLLPTFVRFVRAELGDAGDVAVSVLTRYGKLTLGSIRREVLRSAPFAESAVRDAIAFMADRKWIVACGEGGAGGAGGASSSAADSSMPAEKKLRSEVSFDDTTPYEVSFPTLLHAMRCAAVKDFAANRFNALGSRIIATMIENDSAFLANRGSMNYFDSPASIMRGASSGNVSEEARRRIAAGFGGTPQLPSLSTSLTIGQLHQYATSGSPSDALSTSSSSAAAGGGSFSYPQTISANPLPRLDPSDASQVTFRAKLKELCSDDFGALLQEGDLGSSGGGGTAAYVLNYGKAVTAMRERLVEKIVFARYGVVGTRILKLLFQKGAFEDRHIAEECICSLFEAREALFGMQRDGYVRQLEIPKHKVDHNAERNPKNSNYLWAVSKEAVVTHARRHMAAAIRTTRARLLFELKRLEDQFPAEFSKGIHWLLNGGSVVAVATAANAVPPTAAAAAAQQQQDVTANGLTNPNRGSLTPAQHEDLLRLRFACRSLMTAQLAQMEMMLLMDYY